MLVCAMCKNNKICISEEKFEICGGGREGEYKLNFVFPR